MKELFDICVEIIKYLAQQTGTTYEEMNIWLFVIIHPAITLILFFRCVYLKYKLRSRFSFIRKMKKMTKK